MPAKHCASNWRTRNERTRLFHPLHRTHEKHRAQRGSRRRDARPREGTDHALGTQDTIPQAIQAVCNCRLLRGGSVDRRRRRIRCRGGWRSHPFTAVSNTGSRSQLHRSRLGERWRDHPPYRRRADCLRPHALPMDANWRSRRVLHWMHVHRRRRGHLPCAGEHIDGRAVPTRRHDDFPDQRPGRLQSRRQLGRSFSRTRRYAFELRLGNRRKMGHRGRRRPERRGAAKQPGNPSRPVKALRIGNRPCPCRLARHRRWHDVLRPVQPGC